MTAVVIAVIVAGLAAVAIERSIAAGRYRAEAATNRIRAESYRAEVVRLKHDYQRVQAAQESALEAAQVAIGSGDPRRALTALASMQPHEPRLYDADTSDMLAEAAAAATSKANGVQELRARAGLLGRLARGTDRDLGGESDTVDDRGGKLPRTRGGTE